MRIALAQIDCRLGNLPANIATHREALAAVQAQDGADLVVFPELSLTGYRLRSSINRVMQDDAQFAKTWNLLRAEGCVPAATHCALGYVELSSRAALHNSVALLRGDADAPLFRHRKVYLPNYGMFEEQRYMRSGSHFDATNLAVNGEHWRVGVLCCEDAWHSSAWLILQARGVDLIVVPSASPGRGVESERLGSQQSWYGILSTQAELTGCWVVYCNRVGFEDDINFWGGSAVFAPDGEMVAHAPLMDPAVLVHEIDKASITRARLMTPLTADEEWALTLRELGEAREASLWE